LTDASRGVIATSPRQCWEASATTTTAGGDQALLIACR
jgi:hypothetical protein